MAFGWCKPYLPVMVASLALAGCNALPRSGPSAEAVTGGATTTVPDTQAQASFQYVVLDVRQDILPFVSEDHVSLAQTFGLRPASAPQIRLGVGDVVAVTIFESATGGLFIPKEAGARPGNFVTLPNAIVDRSGSISIPYGGRIPVLGRTLADVQAQIEQRLVSRAIEPQVNVSLVSQRSNEVSVIGHVNTPGKFGVTPGGERVLDLLARAGGLKKEPYDTSITIQRGGRSATVPFDVLIGKPSENVYLGVGDTLYVVGEPKAFVALGAAGNQQRHEFGARALTLAEAVGKSGGLLDNRADPGQVFVFRHESRAALVKMGADLSMFPRDQKLVPAVYRTNLHDARNYFSARKFAMRDKDVLFISNAASVELQKFLELLSAVPYRASTIGYF